MSTAPAPQWSVDDFDLLQVAVVDINGIPRGKIIPGDIAKKMFANNGCELYQHVQCIGVAMDLPLSVPEVISSPFENFFYLPMSETLVGLPWASKPGRRVGQIIGHIVDEDGTHEPTTVRYQVARQVERLQELGYTLKSSFNCQFTAFKADSDFQKFLGGEDSLTTTPYTRLGCEQILFDVCEQLQQAGVGVETWSGRKGRGAFEISMAPKEGISIADKAVLLRHGVKGVLTAHGYKASFVTYPHSADVPATGFYRLTLSGASGQNAFLDQTKEDKISDLARYWLAGMIHHGKGMTALCCPTVNCYKWFDLDPDAPKYLNWEVDGLTSYLSVLVKGTEVWIENRLPTAASNPYFVLLASLAAGIDGVKNKFTCPEKSHRYASPVPETLSQALNELKADAVLEEAMSPLLLRVFASSKGDNEVVKFKEAEKYCGSDREQKLKDLEKHFYLTRL